MRYLSEKKILNFFLNGDTGNKTTPHNANGTTLLRLENRQTKPPKLSIPRRQDPELSSVLQNPNGILLLVQLQDSWNSTFPINKSRV